MSEAILSNSARYAEACGRDEGLQTANQTLTTEVRNLEIEFTGQLDRLIDSLADIIGRKADAFEVLIAALRAENEKLRAQTAVLEEMIADHEAALIKLRKGPAPNLFGSASSPEQNETEIETRSRPNRVIPSLSLLESRCRQR